MTASAPPCQWQPSALRSEVIGAVRRCEVRLEIGSGYAPEPGFVHLDLNPHAPELDICGPAFPIEALPDESCVEIRCVDVLEHISYRETDAALREWARLLRPGGRIFIQVPDADAIMRRYAAATRSDFVPAGRRGWPARGLNTPAGVEDSALAGAEWRLLGGHADGERAREGDDWRLNAHYSLWSPLRLRSALAAVGLVVPEPLGENLRTNGHPNVLCWAEKPETA